MVKKSNFQLSALHAIEHILKKKEKHGHNVHYAGNQ